MTGTFRHGRRDSSSRGDVASCELQAGMIHDLIPRFLPDVSRHLLVVDKGWAFYPARHYEIFALPLLKIKVCSNSNSERQRDGLKAR